MRSIGLFLFGMIFGIVAIRPGAAQTDRAPALNHVGIRVRNLEEARTFYTKNLGLHEAFELRNPDGTLLALYLQISHETFLELQPATPADPPGLNHFGLETPNLDSTVAALRQGQIAVDNPRVGRSNAPLTNLTGPDGERIELLQLGPESLQRKAMESWK